MSIDSSDQSRADSHRRDSPLASEVRFVEVPVHGRKHTAARFNSCEPFLHGFWLFVNCDRRIRERAPNFFSNAPATRIFRVRFSRIAGLVWDGLPEPPGA